MVDIATRPPATRAIVAEIAKRQNIPAFYLAKIMPRLARAGLVHTSLGAAGGITLAIPADSIFGPSTTSQSNPSAPAGAGR